MSNQQHSLMKILCVTQRQGYRLIHKSMVAVGAKTSYEKAHIIGTMLLVNIYARHTDISRETNLQTCCYWIGDFVTL